MYVLRGDDVVICAGQWFVSSQPPFINVKFSWKGVNKPPGSSFYVGTSPAYEIAAKDIPKVIDYLDFREKNGYKATWVTFHPKDL